MVTLQQAAMQQALEALERADKISGHANNRKAIAGLRQALAADTKPCACCGEGNARLSVTRVCDTCGSEYAGQAEMDMAKRIEAEPVAQPFNTWSSNEGDSWYDDPADAQIIEDAFGGDMPVIGDEYEVLAGWRCVTARYRITFVSGDGDCEVDCVSHPHPKPAQCVGLTDEQIDSCFPVQWEGEFYKPWRKAVARAIEAKLREKNGGAA